MSLTMRSNRHSIDFTMSGFMRCRTRIAELISPEVGAHYRSLQDAFAVPVGGRKVFWGKHDEATERLIREGKLSENIADFLYASDAGANLSPAVAQSVIDVIEGVKEEDAQYGPPNSEHPATWISFKNILWDCVLDKTWLSWS